MGTIDTILQQDTSAICCSRCSRVIGDWSWLPSADMSMEPPTFRIDVAEIMEMNLTLDVTPCQTPRLDDYSRMSEYDGVDDDRIIPSKS